MVRTGRIAAGLVATLLATVAMAGSTLAGDMVAGKQKAKQACQVCHGLDGIATMPIAPHIAGESEIYLQNQLKAFRSGKREHEIMSVIAEGLSDEEIANVSAWYAAIQINATIPE